MFCFFNLSESTCTSFGTTSVTQSLSFSFYLPVSRLLSSPQPSFSLWYLSNDLQDQFIFTSLYLSLCVLLQLISVLLPFPSLWAYSARLICPPASFSSTSQFSPHSFEALLSAACVSAYSVIYLSSCWLHLWFTCCGFALFSSLFLHFDFSAELTWRCQMRASEENKDWQLEKKQSITQMHPLWKKKWFLHCIIKTRHSTSF